MKRALVLCVVVSAALAGSCNRRVFEEVKSSCQVTIGDKVDVPTEKAADILIVVDNSGSMQEEQDELVANFVNLDPNQCPLINQNGDLVIPDEFKNPVRDLYTGNGPLAQCGFIQLLAAFENDFRVGVITTDVGLCDNKFPDGQAAACVGGGCRLTGEPCDNQNRCDNVWGFRPQRGCLQPDSAPGGTERKFIAAADLTDADNGNDNFAQRFADTLENIRTFGSPFERGLDAMSIFLDPDAVRAPGCEGDLGVFRRDDAALVVIFLTDEEDCSHGLGDGSFDNELEGEICGEFLDMFTQHDPGGCYENEANLPPPSIYVDQLFKADPKAKVAVIAGGLGEPGNVEAAGCITGGDGRPLGGCFESGGSSNFTQPGQICSDSPDPNDPDTAIRDGRDCCTGDGGGRYYEFANAVGKKTTDSICNASFRGTMLDIAAFIAAVDFVELPEEPPNPNLIVVELTRADTGETTTIPPIAADADCVANTGWKLENGTRVVLCGDARPGPGDTIDVRAAGAPSEECLAAQ